LGNLSFSVQLGEIHDKLPLNFGLVKVFFSSSSLRNESNLNTLKNSFTFQSIKKACYIGCYNDTAIRDMSFWAISSSSLTIEQCITTCSTSGYLYAGVQFR